MSPRNNNESKFKPWRKGKSSEKRGASRNISLKNRLRGQRRLLSKLTGANDFAATADQEAIVEGIQKKIADLEKEVMDHQKKEREKKNCSKYHQVKFIERQKLTRLEKSLQRQIQQLKNDEESQQDSILKLQLQLNNIAMDQLYVAFYPPDIKYMSLFTHGMNRVIDDERAQKKRREIWNTIRQRLLQDNRTNDSSSSSCPSSDSDNDDLTYPDHELSQTCQTKSWVNLKAAKEILLSMPSDTYPNAPSLLTISHIQQKGCSKGELEQRRKKARVEFQNNEKTIDEENNDKKTVAVDSRFVLSKNQDGLFGESTTGDDYQKELPLFGTVEEHDSNTVDDGDDLDKMMSERHNTSSQGNAGDDSSIDIGSSSSDESTTSFEEDTYRLNGSNDRAKTTFLKGRKLKNDSHENYALVLKESEQKKNANSSSSKVSYGADESAAVSNVNDNQVHNAQSTADQTSATDDHDDFFLTEKVSTEDVFAQAQKNIQKDRHAENQKYPFVHQKRDKSKGFMSQNQTKTEYRNFQRRQKKRQFG